MQLIDIKKINRKLWVALLVVSVAGTWVLNALFTYAYRSVAFDWT